MPGAWDHNGRVSSPIADITVAPLDQLNIHERACSYSPLGRGLLTGKLRSPDDFAQDDFRRSIPRFSPENFYKNLDIVDKFGAVAKQHNATTGQLALAWLLAQGPDVIPIPG